MGQRGFQEPRHRQGLAALEASFAKPKELERLAQSESCHENARFVSGHGFSHAVRVEEDCGL